MNKNVMSDEGLMVTLSGESVYVSRPQYPQSYLMLDRGEP